MEQTKPKLQHIGVHCMEKRQCLGVQCSGLQGLQKKGPAPATDLGLGKGSEDGHQLLVFHVVSRAECNVEDVDRLLTDVLATNPTVNPGQQHHCCPSTTWEYQQQFHAHLGVLLIIDGGLCLAEEPAVRRGVGKARDHFIKVPAQTAGMGSQASTLCPPPA